MFNSLAPDDYLYLSRQILAFEFEGKQINKKVLLNQHEELKNLGATFITLTQNNQLRGCIGSLQAHRNVLDDIEQNTLSAAFRDPRFKPLCQEELANTKIEISFLSEPQKIAYDNFDILRHIITSEDGVILELEGKRATYLPQVWEQLQTFDDFFTSLAQKAGIQENIFLKHPSISTYRVHKIKEQ